LYIATKAEEDSDGDQPKYVVLQYRKNIYITLYTMLKNCDNTISPNISNQYGQL